MAPTWFPLFLYVELIESQASLYREPDSENYYRVIPTTAPVESSAHGRKLPLISIVLSVPERPLPVKADVQILALEILLPSDRYTPVSGHQADTMSRGR